MAQAFAAHGARADDFIVAPGPQGAVGHDMGSGPIAAGVPIVIDIWPRDNESFVLLRHDAHVRRRRRAGRRARVAPALQGGARPRDLRDQGTAPTAARSSTARARSSRRPASRRSARRSRASRSRTASSTGSATASGSRCTRQPGMGLASKAPLRGGRRRHGRAGLLPAGLRRRAARGPRARHRGRRREPDAVPVRPRAVSRARTSTRSSSEERRYPPPPEFAAQANAQPGDLRRGLRGVLGARGARARHVVRAVHEALRVGAAVREVVPRRQAERRVQLPRPARRGRARRRGRLPLGGRAGGRPARRSPTPTCSAR